MGNLVRVNFGKKQIPWEKQQPTFEVAEDDLLKSFGMAFDEVICIMSIVVKLHVDFQKDSTIYLEEEIKEIRRKFKPMKLHEIYQESQEMVMNAAIFNDGSYFTYMFAISEEFIEKKLIKI